MKAAERFRCETKQRKQSIMSNNNVDLTLDTAEPLSPIERISDPADAFDEEDLDAQKLDSAKIDPAELAQYTAMGAGYFDGPIPPDIAAPPGLSPKRAELARFLEWRRRTETEIEALEEAHHRAIEALGSEATTKRKSTPSSRPTSTRSCGWRSMVSKSQLRSYGLLSENSLNKS
jgi:hypothetical protein